MRSRSFTAMLNQMARESARQQRRAEAQQRQKIRERVRAERAIARQRALEDKEEKQRYVESRIAEAEEATLELNARVEELNGILEHTLHINDTLSFESLKVTDDFPPFEPDESLALPGSRPAKDAFRPTARPPGLLGKIIPPLQTRYTRSVHEAERLFASALAEYEAREVERQRNLQDARREYEDRKAVHIAKMAAKNQEIDEFKTSYFAGEPTAIVGYCSMVLERSCYPEGFPQEFRAAYVPESKQLVVDYELLAPDAIPQFAGYRYIKAKDEIQSKPRKPGEIRELYTEAVAATTLRTCHELLEADQGRHLEVIAFNGHVQTVDPATGKNIRPCLISLRVTRERFDEIDLSRIDKRVCLRNLGAQISPRPYEVQPVKPLVEFDMVDKRFVEQSDVLADLESRPNLMDLNPYEFENLISNLFQQLGLETKLTRSSRDGGVDVVAFDVRPVLGGKVVIQAKRYKNTVGVSAVRDLYGTMMNEGANKGILVTTSGYGPDAFNFAKDKPIELMEGSHLLYLLDQCGVRARIVFPDDWQDGGNR